MDEQIIKIIKDKDDFENIVEIHENAKGEPQVSVKARGKDAQEVVERALKSYNDTKKNLKKPEVKK